MSLTNQPKNVPHWDDPGAVWDEGVYDPVGSVVKNQTKNLGTMTNQPLDTQNRTWNSETGTWGNANKTWAFPGQAITNQSKNNG